MGRRRNSFVAPKTPEQLDAMEAAGRIVGSALKEVAAAAQPGVSTAELDRLAESVIRDHGATPTFKGFEGFPASICASVNDAIVHGIPSEECILAEGDLLSVDCGATLNGWVGDSALTVGVGELAADDVALNEATQWILEQGIDMMRPGNRLTDISHALEMATRAAEKKWGYSFGIVEGYGGHGIGRTMHEAPFLPNEGRANRGPRIVEGSVLAIEPMITLGSTDSWVGADGWTVYTNDGSRSSHWEHTVAATAQGPRILTPRP